MRIGKETDEAKSESSHVEMVASDRAVFRLSLISTSGLRSPSPLVR